MARYGQELLTAVLAGGFASTQSWYYSSECTKPKNKTSQESLRKDFMVKWKFAHPHLAQQQDVMDRAWNQRKDDPSAMERYNSELDEKIRLLKGRQLNMMFTPVTSQKTLNEAAGQRQTKEDFILQRPQVPSVSSMPPLKVSRKVVVPRSLIVPVAVASAPHQSKWNICERRMAPLSRVLAGLIFPYDYFGSHLNSSGVTIEVELEKRNFQAAGIHIFGFTHSLVCDVCV